MVQDYRNASNKSISVRGVERAMASLARVRTGYGQNVKWVVGVGAEYGAYLEFGTSQMQAYPFLFPAARHVVRTELPVIESEAGTRADPIGYIVRSLATEIEAQAKRNATAAGAGRSPGTHPTHPQRQTSNLVGSIEAAPATEFQSNPTGGFI